MNKQPMPMDKIIKNAQKHGFAPIKEPIGKLIRRRCPECNTIGGVLIFRRRTEDENFDICACECGYRKIR